MTPKATIKYFWDVNMFTIPFSILQGIVFGVKLGIISFASFGVLIGLLGFHLFKKHEYYAYYNLGLTKVHLAKKVWFINIGIAAVMWGIYLIVGSCLNI